YPPADITTFFKEKLAPLKDLTGSKLLVKVKELLGFSERAEKYRIQWEEDEGFLVGNKKKAYPHLTLKTITFLKQEYLIMPDELEETNNRWLDDLCNTDSGDIELIGLAIENEDPTKDSRVQKIVYTPLNSKFVVLLKPYDPAAADEFLSRIMETGIKKFHRSYTVIPFSPNDIDEESLKEALEGFGNYLKKSKRSVLN
ncbi:MAG: hypothetical protein GY940_45030, partial [bacterium]|nr:hypothetical protein [bacterium]